MRLLAEIISTGDEVLTGAIVDTNAAYIAEKLTGAGVVVSRQSTVGDDMETLTEAFRASGDRADIVMVTGGLGPTGDDLTAQAAAEASGLALQLDSQAFLDIQAYFNERSRSVKEANRKQAMFPRGAVVLKNPVGTAPGFSMKIGKACFFFMPGVPYEMRRMMETAAIPGIRRLQGRGDEGDLTRILSIFGVPESEAATRLTGFYGRFPDLKLGFQVKYPGILLKIYQGEGRREVMGRRIDEAALWICNILGDRVVSTEGAGLVETVGSLLKERIETLSTAESCTGGLISHMLTNIPGSSDFFRFSGVTYANDTKSSVLSVPPEILEKQGAVHEETVSRMAEGARAVSGATYGLSTSGIAGPTGGTDEKPVGTVCIGLATPEGTFATRRLFTFGGRVVKKQMFAAAALDFLRLHLLQK